MKIQILGMRSFETELIFYDYVEGGNKIVFYNFYTGVAMQSNPGEEIPKDYIMKIPYAVLEDFYKAMAEFLDKKGVKTENDHKIQGTLEATKFHLNDLRKLLKIDRPS